MKKEGCGRNGPEVCQKKMQKIAKNRFRSWRPPQRRRDRKMATKGRSYRTSRWRTVIDPQQGGRLLKSIKDRQALTPVEFLYSCVCRYRQGLVRSSRPLASDCYCDVQNGGTWCPVCVKAWCLLFQMWSLDFFPVQSCAAFCFALKIQASIKHRGNHLSSWCFSSRFVCSKSSTDG